MYLKEGHGLPAVCSGVYGKRRTIPFFMYKCKRRAAEVARIVYLRKNNMDTVKTTVYSTEILNRKEYYGVSMTLDFDNTDDLVIKAGTPIDATGNMVLSTPWQGVVGILLHDVCEECPQGVVLTEAYINAEKAQENCGLEYDTALATALNVSGCRIRFEELSGGGDDPTSNVVGVGLVGSMIVGGN